MKTKLAALVAGILASAALSACSVPVYRYALERWPAEIYPVTIVHKGPLSPDDAKTVAWMKACSTDANVPSNVTVEDIDVEKPPAGEDAAKLKDLKARASADTPLIIVEWPEVYDKKPEAWSGPLTRENAKAVLDSPARREIGRRLLSGDVCVWVILGSRDTAADDALEKLVKGEIEKLTKTLELPEVDPADVQEGAEKPNLKISLGVVRLARSDPAEKVFAAMLLGAQNNVPDDKPGLGTVFGQGRLLCTLPPTDVNASMLGQIGQFLCGSCSCIVKDQNPGVDLLMSVNWTALPDAKWVKPQDPPALTGLGTAAQAQSQPHKAPPAHRAGKVQRTYFMGLTLFITTAGIVLVAAIVVLVIVFRHRPESR